MSIPVRNALDRRTDLAQSKRSMEATEINIRFFRTDAAGRSGVVNYGLAALGGTRLPTQLIPFAIQKGYGSIDLVQSEQPELDGRTEHQLSDRHVAGRSQPRAHTAAI